MDVKQLKVYQSVKVGSKELTFISSQEYKIDFKPEYQCCVIDDTVIIPCNNIPWMMLKERHQDPVTVKRPTKHVIEV